MQDAWDRNFAWKVRRRMRYDRNPLLARVQDKMLLRDYARERAVPMAALLHVTRTRWFGRPHGHRLRGEVPAGFRVRKLYANGDAIRRKIAETEDYVRAVRYRETAG